VENQDRLATDGPFGALLVAAIRLASSEALERFALPVVPPRTIGWELPS
jgi:hypothetical protein